MSMWGMLDEISMSLVEFKVERKEEFGGNKLYKTYQEVEDDFRNEVRKPSHFTSINYPNQPVTEQ